MVLTVPALGSLAARCLLAATFLVAGAAKLVNRRASNQALRDFGVPLFAQPLLPLLAPGELVVAVGFLFAVSTWYAAWAAFALLVVFIAGIAANLARGQRPPCNCFGQLQSKPIGWRTLARNGALAACAAWLIASGPPQPAADLWFVLRGLDAHGRAVALAAVVVMGVSLMWALRQEDAEETDAEPLFVDEEELPARPYRQAAVAARTEAPTEAPTRERRSSDRVLTGNGLAIGTPAPAFALPDLDGQPHSLDSLRAAGTPVLLIFSSPYCESCQALAPKLPGLAALHRDALRMVLITQGSAQQNREKVKDPGALLVLLQQENEVAEAYDCTSTPAAVLVDADGVVQSPLAVGAPDITQLISLRTAT